MKGRRGRSPFVALDHIKDFNELKAALQGKPFTKNLFRNELRKISIPCNDLFWGGFIKLRIIKRISKEQFVFVDDKPVHFKLLENIYLDYCNRLAGYIRNSEVRKAREEQEAQIAEAVRFLKGLGFQIYAPVEDLYSKL